mmetsp:Transcript_9626/g.13938  ORF Transcript_9626/g.13938 Transcript_9626/m.13938 type:complete len:505 (+) Transcript_9626:1304-2818(+)
MCLWHLLQISVNVSVASTSDISTSQEKKRAFLVEGILRPPRRAIMSQTYTGTAIEKKTVSIRATPEKIHIKSGMLQNEKDTPFSSLSQMYVCNIDASVQHKNEVHLQSNKLSVPTNSPDHMCSHDSIDEEKSASDTRSKDVNELGGQSSVDDVNMLSATINNTSKNEVSLEIHKAIDAKHVLCEPTPSQNNAAEILLQICHPYQSTTSSPSMLRGNISSNEIINHNMMAEDKMDLVDESVIKERMGVDPSASEMASTHLQDVENTSSCISPTPKKAPIQGKDEEIEMNKSNNSGQAIISTPLPSHRSPSADHALDHGADFIGKNYASAKTIVTPSPAAASVHKNEYFTSINRTQPRQNIVVPVTSCTADNNIVEFGGKEDVSHAKRLHFAREEEKVEKNDREEDVSISGDEEQENQKAKNWLSDTKINNTNDVVKPISNAPEDEKADGNEHQLRKKKDPLCNGTDELIHSVAGQDHTVNNDNSTSKVPPQTIKNNNEGGLLTQA